MPTRKAIQSHTGTWNCWFLAAVDARMSEEVIWRIYRAVRNILVRTFTPSHRYILLMVIYGYRRKGKSHGECVGALCGNCHNRVIMHLFVFRTWITLFFIPIIPVRQTRALVCPQCSNQLKLNRKFVDASNDMVSITRQWRENTITDSQYGLHVDAYWALTTSQQKNNPSGGPSERVIDPFQLPPPPPL